jgi:hypothetical protein
MWKGEEKYGAKGQAASKLDYRHACLHRVLQLCLAILDLRIGDRGHGELAAHFVEIPCAQDGTRKLATACTGLYITLSSCEMQLYHRVMTAMLLACRRGMATGLHRIAQQDKKLREAELEVARNKLTKHAPMASTASTANVSTGSGPPKAPKQEPEPEWSSVIDIEAMAETDRIKREYGWHPENDPFKPEPEDETKLNGSSGAHLQPVKAESEAAGSATADVATVSGGGHNAGGQTSFDYDDADDDGGDGWIGGNSGHADEAGGVNHVLVRQCLVTASELGAGLPRCSCP